jgi:surface-anchored protein
LSGTASALQSTAGQHLEITPEYQTSTSKWLWNTVWNGPADPIENFFFSGIDATATGGGIRVTRAADSKWDFIGVAAGEPFWRFRDVIVGTPGFGDTQGDLAGNPMDFRLHSVQGPVGGSFSLYFSNNNPVTYFRTDDGIDGTDHFPKPDEHTHLNWAFTKKGLWIVNLTVQGTLNASNTPTPVSTPQPLAFAIGRHAIWKAASFTMAELQDAAVSGDTADPDGDGWNNLMEYALGGNPLVTSALRADDGQALAPRLLPPASAGAPWRLSYFRRTAVNDSELSYEVESSMSLGSPLWNLETGIETILSSDEVWEHVSIPLGVAQGAGSSCLFRLKVSYNP